MRRKLTTIEFITKANTIHNNEYTYPTEYSGAHTKLDIICIIHGKFSQTPACHLSGRGCPKCGVDKKRSTTNAFVINAKKIHGDKYQYPDSYINAFTKINIICGEHGRFTQTPTNHLSGNGCPSCGKKAYTFKLC